MPLSRGDVRAGGRHRLREHRIGQPLGCELHIHDADLSGRSQCHAATHRRRQELSTEADPEHGNATLHCIHEQCPLIGQPRCDVVVHRTHHAAQWHDSGYAIGHLPRHRGAVPRLDHLDLHVNFGQPVAQHQRRVGRVVLDGEDGGHKRGRYLSISHVVT